MVRDLPCCRQLYPLMADEALLSRKGSAKRIALRRPCGHRGQIPRRPGAVECANNDKRDWSSFVKKVQGRDREGVRLFSRQKCMAIVDWQGADKVVPFVRILLSNRPRKGREYDGRIQRPADILLQHVDRTVRAVGSSSASDSIFDRQVGNSKCGLPPTMLRSV
jgi:hypothetical protein